MGLVWSEESAVQDSSQAEVTKSSQSDLLHASQESCNPNFAGEMSLAHLRSELEKVEELSREKNSGHETKTLAREEQKHVVEEEATSRTELSSRDFMDKSQNELFQSAPNGQVDLSSDLGVSSSLSCERYSREVKEGRECEEDLLADANGKDNDKDILLGNRKVSGTERSRGIWNLSSSCDVPHGDLGISVDDCKENDGLASAQVCSLPKIGDEVNQTVNDNVMEAISNPAVKISNGTLLPSLSGHQPNQSLNGTAPKEGSAMGPSSFAWEIDIGSFSSKKKRRAHKPFQQRFGSKNQLQQNNGKPFVMANYTAAVQNVSQSAMAGRKVLDLRRW